METEAVGAPSSIRPRPWLCLVLILASLALAGCGLKPYGYIYTNIKLPLTEDLDNTPIPGTDPDTGRILEIKEPFTGAGIYARVNSNAIGDIAKENGMHTLYFADQQLFSILGIWKVERTILYGE
jgi:hypothetical protein